MAATVSARREALAELARSRRAEGSAGRMVRIAAVVAVLSGLLGLAWLFLAGGTPAEVRALEAAVDGQIAQLQQAAVSGKPFDDADGSFRAVFEAARGVPDAYRDRARAEVGRLFEARERAEVDSYFAVPPERRAAELDRRIKADEERRKQWEAEREGRSADRGGPERSATQASAQPAGQPAPTAAAPGGVRRDGSEEGRNARSKQRIDSTSAESRARRTEYRRALDQRRIQLGLEPRR